MSRIKRMALEKGLLPVSTEECSKCGDVYTTEYPGSHTFLCPSCERELEKDSKNRR